MTSAQWTVYGNHTKRITYRSAPASSVTAETVAADGFVISSKDHAGIATTASRSYTAVGIAVTRTDGRGNATTTVTDKAGRVVSVTDAAGNATTTAYDANCDQPSVVTDAMGNTACYKYDIRGRKTAEWGTATRPLSIQKDGTWHAYGWDLAKNTCETFGGNGYIAPPAPTPLTGPPRSNGAANTPMRNWG